MSKIIIPQELEQQIVALYKAGNSRKEIKRKLNTPFSDSVIKRVLLEHGVQLRLNPGAQASAKKAKKKELKYRERFKIKLQICM